MAWWNPIDWIFPPLPEVSDTPDSEPRLSDEPVMSIHFERGHDDAHYLLCEDCGERVQIVGEGIPQFEPGGCDCPDMEYRFEVVDKDDD